MWLTGLSGSGKSTVAVACEALLVAAGRPAYLLDGDNLRHGLNGDLGFTADRPRRERPPGRARSPACFADAGLVALVPLISPYRADRDARAGAPRGGRAAVRRGVRRHADRGVRAARPQGPLRQGPGRRDHRLHRHRRPLRGAGATPSWSLRPADGDAAAMARGCVAGSELVARPSGCKGLYLMRWGWSVAQLLLPPRLVLAEVALEPAHLAVALEGEDVGGDAVEEPAVVADHHRAAGERLEGVLEGAQGVDVEVVGGLVEQQHVPALLEHLGELHAVALAAGEHADLLLLVGALEVEAADVGPAVDLLVAELHEVGGAAGDLLVDGTCRRRGRRGTGRRRRGRRCRRREGAGVGLLLAGDHAEQRGLAGAVGADHADDAGGGQREGEVVDQQPVAEALVDVLGLDHHVAEAAAGRELDLQLVGAAVGRLGLGLELLVGGQAGLALGLAGLGRHAHPLELALERAAAASVAASPRPRGERCFCSSQLE